MLPILLIGVSLLSFADKDKPLIQVTAATSHVLVAEPFDVTVRVTANQNQEIQFEKFDGMIGELNVIQIRDQFNLPIENTPHLRLWKRTFTVESYQSGSIAFPSVAVSVSSRSDSATYRSDPLMLEIRSGFQPSEAEPDMREIFSTVDAPQSESTSVFLPLIIGVGAVATVSISLLLARLLVSRKPNALAQTLQRLDKILEMHRSSDTSLSPATSQEAFLELESAIKAFVDWKFLIQANGLTREQLLERLCDNVKHLPEPDQTSIVTSLRDILIHSEQARFGGIGQTNESLESSVAESKSWIQRVAKIEWNEKDTATTPITMPVSSQEEV